MNTPNKLTVARMVITPLLMFTLLADFLPYRFLISFVLFAVGSLTDFVDGHLARKYGIVTNFGKFLDPLADKMLTTAALIGLLVSGTWPKVFLSVVLFLTLFREFLVSSLRLVLVTSGGTVVAANFWGKAKTVTQMVSILLGLAAESIARDFGCVCGGLNDALYWITLVLLGLATLLCVISGGIYLFRGRGVIDPRK